MKMEEKKQFGIAMFCCGVTFMFFIVGVLNDFGFFCR